VLTYLLTYLVSNPENILINVPTGHSTALLTKPESIYISRFKFSQKHKLNNNRWLTAQRYYVQKTCFQENCNTKVVCLVMWTCNICVDDNWHSLWLFIYKTWQFQWRKQNMTFCPITGNKYCTLLCRKEEQEVKVIWQKVPHGGPIPRLWVTTGGRNLYHWIPGVGVSISVP